MKKLALIGLVIICATAAVAHAAEPVLLYHDGFDKGKVPGVVGKAGNRLRMDVREVLNMERGSFAIFVQSAKAPSIREWQRPFGINGIRGGGYWGMLMGFDMRRQDFLFMLYDVGRYSPPLHLPPNLERWKAGEWHHLAAVWDRNEGIKAYEDGKLVASNWGKYNWAWNLMPETAAVYGPVDEFYIYADPLTDAQIAELAAGKPATGEPIAITPEAKRRANDLARMGWSGESLKHIPAVAAGEAISLSFARIVRSVDAKRPVAQPHEGFRDTTWPSIKYGASIRGERLQMRLAPNTGYDHVRIFLHRKFQGAVVRAGTDSALATINEPFATLWHRSLGTMLTDESIDLTRKLGRLGQIDFYRAEKTMLNLPPKGWYRFAKADKLPSNETGMTLTGQTAYRFRSPAAGTQDAVAAWTLMAPAFGGFQAVTEALPEAHAFNGALVTLVAEGITQPTPVRVTVKEPVHGMRDWLVADVVLQPKGAGRQTYTVCATGRPVVNMPPLKKEIPRRRNVPAHVEDVPGVGFGVKVEAANAVTWHMGDGGCGVNFIETDMAAALPVATEDQVEYMREGYSELMEGHLYRDRRIVIPLTWLCKFAPNHMKTRQMYERVGSPDYFQGIAVPKLEYKEPANNTGWPDWAFWQKQAMEEHRRLINWRIDNQQVRTGEFGGIWNDDTIHTENWYGYALCMDDDGKIKAALRRFLDGNWNHLWEGVGKYTQDNCHFYEEGMGSQAMRMLIDYGDPIATTRAMASSSHYDKWVLDDPEGGLLWKSVYISVNGAWTYGDFGKPFKAHGHASDPMVPAGYLIWYNRHPKAAWVYQGLRPGGVFHGMAVDQVVPAAEVTNDHASVIKTAPGRYGVKPQLLAMDMVGLSDEARKVQQVAYTPPGPIRHYWGAHDTDVHWLNFRVSGDIRWLVDSYKRVCEWFYSHDWLNTGAMASMDRNPLPRYSLIRARMGSIAANRGSSGDVWPVFGLSYVKGANDVAAIVTENLPTSLCVRLYPLTDAAHDLRIRTWRLNGVFDVTLSHDKNDDGEPEGVITKKQMTLDRGAYIDLTLPAKQASILSITPVKPETMVYDLPDPAIGKGTVGLWGGKELMVRVYNLGVKDAENVTVTVTDAASGRKLASAVIKAIAAPLDLKPHYVELPFIGVKAARMTVSLASGADLNRYNNSVTFDAEGSSYEPLHKSVPNRLPSGCDPALLDDSIDFVYKEHLVVRVYNAGHTPIENCLVRVRDKRTGELVVMGEKWTGPIPAAKDGMPVQRGVEYKNINCSVYDGIIIEVDPDKKIADADRTNNRYVIDY